MPLRDKIDWKKQMELCGVVITLFYLLNAIIIEMNTNKVYYCQLRKCHGQKFSVDNFQVTFFPQKDSSTLLIYITSSCFVKIILCFHLYTSTFFPEKYKIYTNLVDMNLRESLK